MLPVLLMNYLQSREQKWHRVSTAFLLTSRRTEIAISAWDPKLRGLLAEDAPVQSCPDRKNWLFNDCGSQISQWRMWISKQSCQCKAKTSQETQKSLQKFLEPTRKPKVIYTDNSLEFGKACEEWTWNYWTSTPHRSETNGIAERAVRKIKERTSAVLLESGLDEEWWADSMECYTYLRKNSRSLGWWEEHPMKGGSEYHFMALLFLLHRW